MRTVTYERFLQRECALIGLTRDDLQTEEEALLRQHFNRAIAEIWNTTVWPQVTAIEERTPVSGLISFEQSGEEIIDTVFAVYNKDPYGDVTYSGLNYAVTDTGIQLTGDLLTSTDNVWVFFRKRCPDYNGDEHSDSGSYVIGDQAYDSDTGDFYKAIVNSPGTDLSDTDDWERLTIPYDFIDYVVHAVYADWLRSEGQNEKAITQSTTTADRMLARELDKLERQQGLLPPFNVKTHLAAYTS